MKKVTIILASVLLTLASCNKEVDANNPNTTVTEPAPNCDCDEVVQVGPSFNVVGDAQTGAPGFTFGSYVTINQCTGVQVNGDWSTADGDSAPYIGECK